MTSVRPADGTNQVWCSCRISHSFACHCDSWSSLPIARIGKRRLGISHVHRGTLGAIGTRFHRRVVKTSTLGTALGICGREIAILLEAVDERIPNWEIGMEEGTPFDAIAEAFRGTVLTQRRPCEAVGWPIGLAKLPVAIHLITIVCRPPAGRRVEVRVPPWDHFQVHDGLHLFEGIIQWPANERCALGSPSLPVEHHWHFGTRIGRDGRACKDGNGSKKEAKHHLQIGRAHV